MESSVVRRVGAARVLTAARAERRMLVYCILTSFD